MPSATQARQVMRSAARYLTEPHPFARKPVTMTPHSVRYADLGKHFTRAAVFYVPTATVLLGWPLAAAYFLNGWKYREQVIIDAENLKRKQEIEAREVADMILEMRGMSNGIDGGEKRGHDSWEVAELIEEMEWIG
ncbi:hypothetical protein CC78DRAFT_585886 [Lojkania enalia]|uniref:Uncharacterized protein n=1 Tax=Lojkania enalia TaxID=147567 RepID=A0A9P4K024_9PLEO|nr:hypothetical protein CC78DRAFT_585886 [Didymosphaeria enalia]